MAPTRREVLASILAFGGGLAAGRVAFRQGSGPRGTEPTHLSFPSDGFLEPFRIEVPSAVIEDLHRRIDSMRWPEMPFETGWEAGTSDAVLRELAAYWRNEYDWYAVQADLNELRHLRGRIEGDTMHCVVYERTGTAPTNEFPLLLLHGWPSSFHEFSRGAPRLAEGSGGTPGFTVVVPSLPGYAFSDVPRERGMSPGRMADRLHALMGELGYDRYGVQGGDWGAIIGTQMARRYPEALVGLHVSFVSSAPAPPDGVEPSPAEVAYREARARFQGAETGYSAIQGTRPQSLAYAQHDSPVGLLAWILEKYWSWSDHGDDLWGTFSRDDILTTAMLYWLPGRILSAARIYYESSSPVPGTGGGGGGGRVQVPTGYTRFPAEPWGPPREVVERTYNLTWYSEAERGGHFPALEQPDVWSRGVAEFFSGLGS